MKKLGLTESVERRLNESSYSRIYSHTQDDSTFAIIGSEDQDTKENRLGELYELIRKYNQKHGHHLGYNKADGTYKYRDRETGKAYRVTAEDSLIIYDIDKETALDFAKQLNQQSIVWKDKDFLGLLYSDGTIMDEFSNEPRNNMSFSDAENLGFGTRLKNDIKRKKKGELGFVFEGRIIYDENDTEDFSFYRNENDESRVIEYVKKYDFISPEFEDVGLSYYEILNICEDLVEKNILKRRDCTGIAYEFC